MATIYLSVVLIVLALGTLFVGPERLVHLVETLRCLLVVRERPPPSPAGEQEPPSPSSPSLQHDHSV